MNDNRGTRVYVGNLTDKVKKEDLEVEFTKYGKLNSVWVAFNPPGFAFVEFENRDDAEKACDVMNGIEILGSQLRVEISKGRSRHSRRGSGGHELSRQHVNGNVHGRRGGFRMSHGSNSRHKEDNNSSNLRSRRAFSGVRDRTGTFDIHRRNEYDRRADTGRFYGSSLTVVNRSGGHHNVRERFRSRSPVGNHRFY